MASISKALKALKSRGMLSATTATEEQLRKSCDFHERTSTKKNPAVYCGFDPTADSLHIGNLIQVMALRHFQLAGIRPIVLLGGATGMIGDPSGKSEERVLLSKDIIDVNMKRIRSNLDRVLDFDCPQVGAHICDNSDWHCRVSAVDWLRDTGRHFRVNAMLTKDSVKKRLETSNGISFLEFSYQLFQAYDFLHLYKSQNCLFQLGGSDQWGNITAGCDLVRKSMGQEVFGITLPLLTSASGEKYGKSAGNAIWMDSKKTSVYDFYQYFIRVADSDVEQHLRTFTMKSIEEITDIMEEHKKMPEKRFAQEALSDSITTLVHESIGLQKAKQSSSVLFGGSLDGLGAKDVLSILSEAPSSSLDHSSIVNRNVVDVVTLSNACKSKAECRRLISNGGLYLNNQRVDDPHRLITPSDLIEDQVFLLRTGKRNYRVVKVQKNECEKKTSFTEYDSTRET